MGATIELLKTVEAVYDFNLSFIDVKYEQSLLYGKKSKRKLHNNLKHYINMSVDGRHCISVESAYCMTHRSIQLINVNWRKGFVYWAFNKTEAERLMKKIVHPNNWSEFKYHYTDNLEEGSMIRIGY